MTDQIASCETQNEERCASEERRAAVRFPCTARAQCQIAGAGAAPWPAAIRDVSSLGVGLIFSDRVEPGTILELELETSEGVKIRRILARVVHVEEEEAGWLAGCAFVNELDEAQLRLFRAEKIRPAGPDSRRWIRFPCNVETVCYTCETAPGERRPASILNVSAGGVGLLLRCQFSVGTLLQFELPAEAARLALIRVVRVVDHSPRGWFHGCEFVDQVGAEELRELVG